MARGHRSPGRRLRDRSRRSHDGWSEEQGKPTSGTDWIAATPRSTNSLLYEAGQAKDKLLGDGAITYTIKPIVNPKGTITAKTIKVTWWTSTGSLAGTGSAQVTITNKPKAGDSVVTNGTVTSRGERADRKGTPSPPRSPDPAMPTAPCTHSTTRAHTSSSHRGCGPEWCPPAQVCASGACFRSEGSLSGLPGRNVPLKGCTSAWIECAARSGGSGPRENTQEKIRGPNRRRTCDPVPEPNAVGPSWPRYHGAVSRCRAYDRARRWPHFVWLDAPGSVLAALKVLVAMAGRRSRPLPV